MHTSTSRLYGADFIRASACFIVLFHHLAQRIDPRSVLGAEPSAQVFNAVGGFGVGMFFVLSGFLLARPFWQALDAGAPMPSLRIYALRRAARIVPGFWLALTVSFVLSVTVFGFALDGWLWLRYLAGLLMVSDWHWTTLFPVEVNGPLWSIGFEASSYVMLPLAFLAFFALAGGRLLGWQARLAWFAVIAFAIFAHWLFATQVRVDPLRKGWDYGLQGGAKTWMPWFNPFGFFAMFATGALAGGVQVAISRFRSVVFDLIALAAMVAAGWMIWTNGLRGGGEFYGLLRIPYQFPLFHVLLGTALATAPSSVVLGRVLDNAVVSWLARISFGIYVWHYLVLELVRLYWVPEMTHATMSDATKFMVASAVITAITIAIAALSWRWLELPAINRARQWEQGARLQPALA
ncbi:MAG TPA: acyltransferase [Devosia sp.]|jgi:peptidoglycan/LPS O-acetylase OafA/YrhL|nr:acyltransferase [Devosia sp.]